MSKQKAQVKTILCIPIDCNDTDILSALIFDKTDGEYFLVGNLLFNVKAKKKAFFEIEICEKDHSMKKLFAGAGLINNISAESLNIIDNHTHIIYLIGEGGSFSKAKSIAKAGEAILKTCGLGIKVETAGIAFEKQQWVELVRKGEDTDLFKMFVFNVVNDVNGDIFSCGMHNLGLKDTIMRSEDEEESIDLVYMFGIYQVVDKPMIKPQQTFALSKITPMYRILEEKTQPYQGEECYENPFGMWRLVKITES